jgi:hypothetical protein
VKRSARRGILLTLLVVVLSSVAVPPSPGLASGIPGSSLHRGRPTDGVGDSPLVP